MLSVSSESSAVPRGGSMECTPGTGDESPFVFRVSSLQDRYRDDAAPGRLRASRLRMDGTAIQTGLDPSQYSQPLTDMTGTGRISAGGRSTEGRPSGRTKE
jgi:hypothetical protein